MKHKFFCVLFLAGCITFCSNQGFSETVTLTTYYPAPFGAYDRIKLVPRTSLPLDPHCNDRKDVGTMYFDNGKQNLKSGIYLCQMGSDNSFKWAFINAPTMNAGGPMSNEKIVCVKKDNTFGICNSSPSFDGTCACQ